MNNPKIPKIGHSEPIVVHDRVLGHLSRGLYRSPASALRELVSNAWDANATQVRIDTGFPRFDVITVEDDGDGFELSSFLEHMRGDVGNSSKRANPTSSRFARPILGRLGIGLLGIAQICGGFRIASRTDGGSQFQARVNLEGNLRRRIDETNSTLKLDQINPDDTSYGIGHFELEESTIQLLSPGTVIIADDPYPSFTLAFKNSISDNYVDMPKDWAEWVELIQKHQTVQELGDYWKLIFDLAASCPVPYLSDVALPHGLAGKSNKSFEKYNFKLFVDGRRICKPLLFNSKDDDAYALTEISSSEATRGPRIHGYLLGKNGSQIKPGELRGVMIRIKEVGIGVYDRTFLDYRENEGPRLNWVTGEIFVDEGLEDALNIDRDSFNRFHADYRAISKHLHNAIQSQLMPELNRKQAERSAKTRLLKEAKRAKLIESVLPAEYAPRTISSSDETKVQTKKINQSLADAMVSIFDASQEEASAEAVRERFLTLLSSLLKEWE